MSIQYYVHSILCRVNIQSIDQNINHVIKYMRLMNHILGSSCARTLLRDIKESHFKNKIEYEHFTLVIMQSDRILEFAHSLSVFTHLRLQLEGVTTHSPPARDYGRFLVVGGVVYILILSARTQNMIHVYYKIFDDVRENAF